MLGPALCPQQQMDERLLVNGSGEVLAVKAGDKQ